MKNETVSVRMATQGQIGEVHTTLIQGVPDLTFEQAKTIIDDKSVLTNAVAAMFTKLFPSPKSTDAQLAEWLTLYADLGITLESGIVIPNRVSGFDRLIVAANGLGKSAMNRVYDGCAKKFPCSKYADDLDLAVPNNDRHPRNGSYAVWVRDRQEADEELKNLSANQLKEQNVKGVTLLERLLYELKYHKETGRHLDIKNWTLCSGSRYSDGSVPDVDWGDGRLEVVWSYAAVRDPSLRSRAVSL
jgi:hypothetical protein